MKSEHVEKNLSFFFIYFFVWLYRLLLYYRSPRLTNCDISMSLHLIHGYSGVLFRLEDPEIAMSQTAVIQPKDIYIPSMFWQISCNSQKAQDFEHSNPKVIFIARSILWNKSLQFQGDYVSSVTEKVLRNEIVCLTSNPY